MNVRDEERSRPREEVDLFPDMGDGRKPLRVPTEMNARRFEGIDRDVVQVDGEPLEVRVVEFPVKRETETRDRSMKPDRVFTGPHSSSFMRYSFGLILSGTCRESHR